MSASSVSRLLRHIPQQKAGRMQQQDNRVLPKIIVFQHFIAYNTTISDFSVCWYNQAFPTKRIVKTALSLVLIDKKRGV